ncbi:Hypothetical predicted protein [Mytilus galloprovincialis]|uniref:FLYWCH-type domain-containing protein n=1 Tax=Mytilus galloprovincialis TaxID=29158 RepID=A0A8B6G0T8_MYTGA|nr:Hypothetical predicted protein [Mytilus galloprovincialis]
MLIQRNGSSTLLVVCVLTFLHHVFDFTPTSQQQSDFQETKTQINQRQFEYVLLDSKTTSTDAGGHYLAVAGYRYCVKTRKQGRDAELVYWKCTEMDCPGTVYTTDNLVTRFPRDHNHPPSHADIKAKLFLSHSSEKSTLLPRPHYQHSMTVK